MATATYPDRSPSSTDETDVIPRPAARLRPQAASQTPPPHRPRVLLIEDEPLTIKYMTKVLNRRGIDVIAPRSLADLRQMYRDLPLFRIVLLDLALEIKPPEKLWGIRGGQLLREMMAVSDLPIYIILTAYGQTAEANACYELGANLVLSKPCDHDQVADLVINIEASYAQQQA